jgi:iron complex transport system substrate-binding protein
MIRTVGALVGALDKAETLARSYEVRLGEVAASVRRWPKPKVYFEEWDDPLISGIGWVSELIELAGGKEAFPELRNRRPPMTVSFRRGSDRCRARRHSRLLVRQEGRSG